MGRAHNPSLVLVSTRTWAMGAPSPLVGPVTGLVGRPMQRRPPLRTFSDCMKAFLAQPNGNLKRSTKKRHAVIVAHLSEFFGNNTKLASISDADVRRYIKRRAAQAASSSIADEVNLLKRALRSAVESGALDRNVADNVRTPTRTVRAKPTLTQGEFEMLLDACPGWLRGLLVVAITTSLTQSDLLKIRFRDIRKHNGRLFLRVRKGRDSRFIQLTAAAGQVLNSAKANAGCAANDRMFRGKRMSTVNISQTFRRAVKSAGLDGGLTFRDLRYVAASWMYAQHVPVEAISAYMGHKTLQMASRYLRPRDRRCWEESLSASLSSIDRYLLGNR